MDAELKDFSQEEINRNFSKVIRETRLLFGLTQDELADMAGVHRTTIIRMEDPLASGTTLMSSIHAVLQVLKINPNRIFYPEKTELNNPKQILMDYLLLCNKEELKMISPYIEKFIEKESED